MSKIIIYIFILPLTIWSFESLDINRIFKKNKELQSKVLYILLSLALSYLVTNLLYDLFY